MLTFTPVAPRVLYHDGFVTIKVGRKTRYEFQWVEAEPTLDRAFLDSHLVHAVGTAFYGTNQQHEYLIERDRPLFLSETPPSGFEFVIELYISSRLLHLTPESLEAVKKKLNVNSEMELAERLKNLQYEGWYCNGQIVLTPCAELRKLTPSYRDYLNGGATILPETVFGNHR